MPTVQDPPDSSPHFTARWRKFFRRAWGVLPAALLLLYVTAPPQAAAITVFPCECWLLAGFGIQLVTLRSWRHDAWRLATCLWLVFILMTAEELCSLTRYVLPVPGTSGRERRLCIASVNCASERGVLDDLLLLRPDLVLIQETTSEAILEGWASSLYGDRGTIVWGRDCSIIGQGTLSPIESPQDAAFTHARWSPVAGIHDIEVFSLRLWPQSLRLDYWNPNCWRSYSDVRRRQCREMAAIHDVLHDVSHHIPVIVGGDFNNPAGDPSADVLRTVGLTDAFLAAGRGWGKTITNDFPFHRIDRVYLSRHFRPLNVTAVRSLYSDHRLVCCEIALAGERQP